MTQYYNGAASALAGQIASSQNAVTVVTEKISGAAVQAGLFVQVAQAGGVQLPKDGSALIYGVIARDVVRDTYNDGDLLPVARLNRGEAIWVKAGTSQTFNRGDKVKASTAGEAATTGADTGFIALDSRDGLVLVTPV